MNMYTGYLNELLVSIEDTIDEYSQSLPATDKLMVELYGQYKLVKELIEKFDEMCDGFSVSPDMLRNVFKYTQDHKGNHHIQSTPHWITLYNGAEVQIPLTNLLDAYVDDDYLYLVTGRVDNMSVQIIKLEEVVGVRHGVLSLDDVEKAYGLSEDNKLLP